MGIKTLSTLLFIAIFNINTVQSQKSQDTCETPHEPIVLNTINKCTRAKASKSDKWSTELSFKKPSRLLYLKNKMLKRAKNSESKKE